MRTNLKMIAAASAFAIAAVAQPAAAADFIPGATGPSPDGNGMGSFTVNGDPFDGSVSGGFQRTGLGAGTFQDRFLFTLGQDGLGSGSITTNLAGALGGVTDLDFGDVFFSNGTDTFTIDIFEMNGRESGGLTNIPIMAGVLNTLTVNYTSRGNGSYGGQLSFVPDQVAAIPEPGTWALMMLGFAGIGMVMRRRRKDQVRVKYAF